MEYMIILAILLLSAVVVIRRCRVRPYKSAKHAILTTLLFLVVGVVWDHYAIYNGHWAFPGSGIVGIYLGLMPLEEYLFVLIVPFWVIVMCKAIGGRRTSNARP